jgi:hypothetical protein
MTMRALVRLGPTASRDAIVHEATAGDRTLYDHGVELFPGREVPLLVNHDPVLRIGTVDGLCRLDDTPLGGVKWLYARAEIDAPPEWLKKGSAASIGFLPIQRVERWGRDIVRRGYVDEVSVLSPSKAPAEPLARVMLLYEPEPKAPKATVLEPVFVPASPAPRKSSRHKREMDELRRRLDAAGPGADFELILEALRQELGYGSSVPWWQAA